MTNDTQEESVGGVSDLEAAFDEVSASDDDPNEPDNYELEPESTDDDQEDLLAPPEHWSQEHRELFESRDRETQEFILERSKSMEADYTRKTQELAKQRKLAEALEESLTPYRQDFEIHGLDEAGAVRRLLAIHGELKSNPEQALMKLAEWYGYQPTQDYSEYEDSDDYVDPDMQRYRNELNEVKTKLQSYEQAQQRQAQQSLHDQFTSFLTAKDDSGNAAHPYAEEVKADTLKIYQAGLASDFSSAYRMAVAAKPEIQQKISEHQAKLQKEAEKREKAQAVSKAKKAASGVKSSSTNVNKGEPGGDSWRDAIIAAMNAQQN